ncbi:MAG: twitching motility protein PilT [Lachnospiraceae bacterium]
MVQIIAGRKGKGKTKILLQKANEAIKEAKGSVVYLDKNTKHMFELNNRVRLINVMDYPINTPESFIGFISGIISQDHDIEIMFLDSFLTLSCLEGKEDVSEDINKLIKLSEVFGITFILSVSMDRDELSEELQPCVTDAL